ncbi:MAG: CRISPR-associated protein [Paludibacteraceae bacterium]|nr:CRISPR-associated protein [Paludibacteraceae bacterium]
MNIKYKIEFHTDWHCGSGLAAGADVDALVVKDEKGMPFIPGKTIKGLIREAVEEIRGLQVEEIRGLQKEQNEENFVKAFGFFDNKEQKKKGCMFFSNVTLEPNEYEAIVSNDAARFMYRDIASTAIDDNGIAKEHSLRKTEVVVPCTLHGEILNVPEEMADEIIRSFGFIKRMGQNRNRGLGRCTITGRKEANNENA